MGRLWTEASARPEGPGGTALHPVPAVLTGPAQWRVCSREAWCSPAECCRPAPLPFLKAWASLHRSPALLSEQKGCLCLRSLGVTQTVSSSVLTSESGNAEGLDARKEACTSTGSPQLPRCTGTSGVRHRQLPSPQRHFLNCDLGPHPEGRVAWQTPSANSAQVPLTALRTGPVCGVGGRIHGEAAWQGAVCPLGRPWGIQCWPWHLLSTLFAELFREPVTAISLEPPGGSLPGSL